MRIVSRMTLAIAGALVLMSAAAATAQAQEQSPPPTSSLEKAASERSRQAREKAKQLQAEAKKQAEEAGDKAREGANAKLEAKKLEVCKKRETNIQNLMTRISSRGSKHVELIDTTLERVKEFKADNELMVANYDALLADTTSKQAAALAAAEAVKNAQVEFRCDGSDPKGAASVFKELAARQAEALKVYKTSVITLLKAVKQAQGSAETAPVSPPAASQEEN